jgi:hypothetical protein
MTKRRLFTGNYKKCKARQAKVKVKVKQGLNGAPINALFPGAAPAPAILVSTQQNLPYDCKQLSLMWR